MSNKTSFMVSFYELVRSLNHDSTSKRCNSRVNPLNSRVKGVNSRVNALNSRVKGANSRVNPPNSRVNAWNTRINPLNSGISRNIVSNCPKHRSNSTKLELTDLNTRKTQLKRQENELKRGMNSFLFCFMLTRCERNTGGFCDDFRNICIFNDPIKGFASRARSKNGNHIGGMPSCGTGGPYASISYTCLIMLGDGASDFPINLMLWIDKRSILFTLSMN